MFIQNTLEVINTFLERYVGYVNESGDYTAIKTINDKVQFTFSSYGNSYSVFAWLEDNELHIENERGESIFDYAEYYDWTPEDVEYIKFGKELNNDLDR